MLNKYEVTEKINTIEQSIRTIKQNIKTLETDYLNHKSDKFHNPKFTCDKYHDNTTQTLDDIEKLRHLALEVCRLLSQEQVSMPYNVAAAVLKLQDALY